MAKGQRRQTVKYTFYKMDPQWRRLPAPEREAGKEEFASVVEEFGSQLSILSYSLMGLRGDTDFMLWCVGPSPETVQELATHLARTGMGRYMDTPYSYLALTHPSSYVDSHRHAHQEGRSATIRQLGRRYLFVYSFVKTHSWYQLPLEERQRMMDEHFRIGHKYPSVKITTTYSFGLDDQEFVLGFETDAPEDFLELVMELRTTEARPYTLRDTPIFTCIHRPLREVLDSLGG